ncbi:MAG TPA: beta-ketoacyl-ACP synthase II [Dehalococcoidia bacterium]|nr:beta-ketoacyl-ACP synthase II [Dehalococcoidia bacterium]
MPKRRVVVTGMGAVTPLGMTVDEFWAGLTAGKSGIGYITQFDATNFPVKIAAEVPNFEPAKYMDTKMVDRTARFTQFAIAATKMAVESAKLDFSTESSERIGVSIATSIDIRGIVEEHEVLKSRGPKRISPLFITRIGPHMASVQVGILFGAKGPNSSVNTACASGADALATANDYIQLGYADVMLAGGTDAAIAELPIAGMGLVGALSREADPAKASRPFDLNRNGFVYGEGAAILILETLEHAMSRGAPILAELAGASRSFDAYNEAAPDPEVEAIAMSGALKGAGIAPEDVDYINTHGTSTKLNDASETKAIKTVFGKHAYKIPVSSNKSMIGHIITAAGAIEAIASILTINSAIIPPTVNYEIPDPECDLDYVPNVARRAEVNVCLSNSFGMGGQNCCLVLKRFTG